MANTANKHAMRASPPTDAIQGKNNSLFMIMRGLGGNPASGRLLRGLTPYLDEHGAENVFLLTERKQKERWRGGEEVVRYQELVHWARNGQGGTFRGACVKGRPVAEEEIVQAFQYEPLGMMDWAGRRMGSAVVSSAEPAVLEPCVVDKPWGRELWFTGVEQRGVSRVVTATGSMELPYALSLFPAPLLGEAHSEPILLKVLQPRPDPVLGDLYLEAHETKWEVYIVTGVDRAAWPDGVGWLRAGLDEQVVASYRSEHGADWEEAVSAALRSAIGVYERVRREIDAIIDAELEQRDLPPTRPIPPEVEAEVMARVPQGKKAEEARRRGDVEAFLGRVPLRKGDVVCLPPRVLHSLQHGVEVIEFQTPTYERLVAMSTQKVVTQSHWDTERALAWMEKAPYSPPAILPVAEDEGTTVERVVDFPQFLVDRVRLEPEVRRADRTEGMHGAYRLLFVTEGGGRLTRPDGTETALEPGMALLLPAMLGDFALQAGAHGLGCLVALPRMEPRAPAANTQRGIPDF